MSNGGSVVVTGESVVVTGESVVAAVGAVGGVYIIIDNYTPYMDLWNTCTVNYLGYVVSVVLYPGT